jgi:aspartyl-tRNA synthetase
LQELNRRGPELAWGEDIPTPAYRALQEDHDKEFYFIVDWPTKAKAFYIKPREDRPELSYGFDLMYEWVEIASGGSRIDRKEQLVQRLKEKGLDPKTFESHLKAYDYGMPPHAGWAFGLERLLMALLGIENIREVTLFPRDRWRLTP